MRTLRRLMALGRDVVGGPRRAIPLNPTPGSEWDASPLPVQQKFVARVRAAGVACTVRDTRGREIAAACGQLAAES
jgi:23S rRNA (adenine2503-C2)-methyltransferase